MADVSAMSPASEVRPGGFVRAALVVLCLTGLFICAVLIQMSMPGADHTGVGSALCRAGRHINCDYVLSSPWARIGGVSVAYVGAAYFTILLIWYVAVGVPNRAGRKWHGVPMALSMVGVGVSVAFTLLMALRMPVWCTWCIAAHAVNALIFLLTLAVWFIARRRGAVQQTGALGGVETAAVQPAYPSKVRAGVTLGAACAGMLIVVLAGLGIMHQANSLRMHRELLKITNDVDYIVWRYRQSPQKDITLREREHWIGRADAPHTLVVFSDFECPACAEFHANVAGLVAAFPDVRCVFRQFPMCNSCNSGVNRCMHVYACDAARASIAFASIAQNADSVHRFNQLLYQNRSLLGSQPYADFARDAGLGDSAAFGAAQSSADTSARLQQDIEQGRAIGVDGTPALFLNGRRLPQWRIISTDGRSTPDPAGTQRLWQKLLPE